MTQQDIVNIVNDSLIDFNINWDRIKYKADKAIIKINSYIGAKFPSMSSIMKSPDHTYSIMSCGVERNIFDDVYIHTIVIPFICMELLAQDEEFTTIYNKFAMDVEDGLFNMFQNEFYNIPQSFRQSEDVGVMFDTKPVHHVHPISTHHYTECDIKFRVTYHVNNEYIMLNKQFTFDTNTYSYKDTCKVLNCTEPTIITSDGAYVYKFLGWSNSYRIPVQYITPGQELVITEDLHLYAIWDKICTIDLDNDGIATIKPEYANLITTLIIPDNIDGYSVYGISGTFTNGCNNLISLVLPKTLITVDSGAFKGAPNLQSIIFPAYDYLRNRPSITLGAVLFANTCRLSHVHIPYSIFTMDANTFNCYVEVIECERLLTDVPCTWNSAWAGANETINWGVSHG